MTEFRKGLNLPTFVSIKDDSPGIILEDFKDLKLVLVNDGDITNMLLVSNSSIQVIGDKNDNRLSQRTF